MNSLIPSLPVRLCSRTCTVLLSLGLTACASSQTNGTTRQVPLELSPLCKTGEAVGFSCQMRDLRTIALCASPGFVQFKGAPKDNPGYAYVSVGTSQGKRQYTYPDNPSDYKKHMYFWVSQSAAPNLFVASDKGAFLHFSLDEKAPVNLTAQNLPKDWQQSGLESPSPCAGQIQREKLDPFMAQMVTKEAWEKAQGKKAAQ